MRSERGAVRQGTSALFALVLLLVSAGATHAQQPVAPSKSDVTMSFRNLSLSRDSARAKARKNADAVLNDTLRYELVFSNRDPVALRGVVFENPLPNNLLLVGGSVTSSAPAKIEYSIDGGRTWSVQPMVTSNINGREVQRPAPPEQYTHIRWSVTGSVAPKATVTARYDARVGVRK